MCNSEFPPFKDGAFAGQTTADANISCQQGCHGELPDTERDRLIPDCTNGNAEGAFSIVTDNGIWNEAACLRGANRRVGAIIAAEATPYVEDRSNEPKHNRNVPVSELCRTEIRVLEEVSPVRGVVRVDRGFRLCEPGEPPGSVKVIDRSNE